MKDLKIFFLETRPQFLTLSVVLAFLGTVIAWHDGSFHIWRALLAGFGLILTHASVNIFNDYFDFRSGIDLATKRTPFSGGSGMLPERLLTPRQVLRLGITVFLPAVAIGIYFIVISGVLLLPLLLVSAFFILLYSPLILKHPWPEWVAGAGLGGLPIIGLYYAQTGEYALSTVIAAIPSAFLVHNLLLLNEFPDVAADRGASRQTMPISIGPRRAAVLFSAVAIGVYVWIAAFAVAGVLPLWTLLALLTLPLTARAINGAIHHDDPSRLIPGMAANVMNVLLTQVLLGAGFIIDGIMKSA